MATCVDCGKEADMVITVSGLGRESPPRCSKCFRAVCQRALAEFGTTRRRRSVRGDHIEPRKEAEGERATG